MSLCGFIVIQKLLILGKEIFSLQHCMQNKAVCKITSFSSGLSPLEKFLCSKILKSFTWLCCFRLFCFSFLSWPANVHIDVACWYLSWKKQITMSDEDYRGRGGRLLLFKVQLLFSLLGAGPAQSLWMYWFEVC